MNTQELSATNDAPTREERPSAAERFENRPTVAPLVDVYEGKDEILVIADVPGTEPEGVNLRLERNELAVHVRRSGKGRPDFVRSFLVPRSVDATKIDAALKNGVLTIRLPKSEASRPRQIAVRAA